MCMQQKLPIPQPPDNAQISRHTPTNSHKEQTQPHLKPFILLDKRKNYYEKDGVSYNQKTFFSIFMAKIGGDTRYIS